MLWAGAADGILGIHGWRASEVKFRVGELRSFLACADLNFAETHLRLALATSTLSTEQEFREVFDGTTTSMVGMRHSLPGLSPNRPRVGHAFSF